MVMFLWEKISTIDLDEKERDLNEKIYSCIIMRTFAIYLGCL